MQYLYSVMVFLYPVEMTNLLQIIANVYRAVMEVVNL